MSYQLQNGTSLNRSLRDAVNGQLVGAVRQILLAGWKNPEGIHQVRKHLKKIRAILRLIKSGLNRSQYKKQNHAARDAGRLLSAARDREMLSDVLVQLTATMPDENADRFRETQNRLDELRDRVSTPSFITRLWVLGKLIYLRWSVLFWPTVFETDVENGWRRGFRRARKRWLAVRKHPDATSVHEWRKRVKDHWYHTRLLQSVCPELNSRKGMLEALSGTLGQSHDLTVFQEWAANDPFSADMPGRADALQDLVEQEQTRLLAKSMSLGEALFRDPVMPLKKHF